MTYAHDAHCNVIHDGPEECPPRCEHDWQVSEFGTSRSCAACQSVVPMRAHGLTMSGWMGDTSHPDISEWLAKLPNGSITVSFGDQDLPEHVGKPVTNEAGERIGTITKATLTQDGDVKFEMRFDER